MDSLKYKNKKIGVAMHDTDEYSIYYDNWVRKGTEFVMYKLCDDVYTVNEIIKNAPVDVIYIRLEHRTFPVLAKTFKKYADVALIRVDRDVTIGRIVKKKRGK